MCDRPFTGSRGTAKGALADSIAARGQEFARRVGICLLDYEMFWWRADSGEACPVCSTDDEGYDANHRFFVAEEAK